MPLFKKDLRFYESIFHLLVKFHNKTMKDTLFQLGSKKQPEKKKSY